MYEEDLAFAEALKRFARHSRDQKISLERPRCWFDLFDQRPSGANLSISSQGNNHEDTSTLGYGLEQVLT